MYSRKYRGNLSKSKPLWPDETTQRPEEAQTTELRRHLDDCVSFAFRQRSKESPSLLLVTCLSPRPRCGHPHAHMWSCRNCLLPWGQANDKQWMLMARHLALTFECVTLNLQVLSDRARTCFQRNESVHFLRQRKLIAGLHLHLADIRETQERLATGQGE